MKIILVPTNFTTSSVTAADFAAAMAAAIQANIMLVHIYQLPVTFSADIPLPMVSEDVLQESVEAKLEELKTRMLLYANKKIEVSTQAILGNVVDKLEKICASVHPFAVVMGTTEKTGVEKAFFGSTLLGTIRHLTSPIIAVPPGKTYGKGIRKIGFACDFRNVAETVPVQLLRDIIWEFDAALYVLNVNHTHHRPDKHTLRETSGLHDLLKDLYPKYFYIQNSDIEKGLTEFALANGIDLIIAIPKKHKLFQGILKPSNTKQLIMHARVPMMCIH